MKSWIQKNKFNSYNGKRIEKKIKKFDYSRKRLENPFFKKSAKIGKDNGLKIKISVSVAILLLCFMVWFIYFSKILKITEINITGTGRVSGESIREFTEEQINSGRFLILPQKKLFLFNANCFSESLIKKYRFEKAVVSKIWPNRLDITVKEKPFVCVWNEDEKFYYADDDGFILEEINPLDIKTKEHPLILNNSGQKISNYKIQVDKKYLEDIQELFEKLNNEAFGITIKKFIIDGDADTIKAETEEGVKISFSVKNDFDKQLDKLLVVKKEKLKEDFNNKKYIDLRFGDKVYYH